MKNIPRRDGASDLLILTSGGENITGPICSLTYNAAISAVEIRSLKQPKALVLAEHSPLAIFVVPPGEKREHDRPTWRLHFEAVTRIPLNFTRVDEALTEVYVLRGARFETDADL